MLKPSFQWLALQNSGERLNASQCVTRELQNWCTPQIRVERAMPGEWHGRSLNGWREPVALCLIP
jgi:hypothetical protein